MLKIKKIEWGNCFSYGEPNVLVMNDARITQLVGANGRGKSSIALIIEEVFFNKNSKGIKKADIPNRELGGSYWIKAYFNSGNDEYIIDLSRKSSLKIKLFLNGVDISSHTGTGTFNTIKEVMGMDHKVFSQLFYQSSTIGLQFLTATDSNRKKFLIDLFSLGEYLEYHEKYKALYKEVNTELSRAEGAFNVVNEWLNSNKSPGVPEPINNNIALPDNSKISTLKEKLNTIKAFNRRISDNNMLKNMLNGIEYDQDLIEQTPVDVTKLQVEANKLSSRCAVVVNKLETERSALPYVNEDWLNKELIDLKPLEATLKQISDDMVIADKSIKGLSGLRGECPTCTQKVPEEFIVKQLASLRRGYAKSEERFREIDIRIGNVRADNRLINKTNSDYDKLVKSKQVIKDLEKERDSIVFKYEELIKEIDTHKEVYEKIVKAKAAYVEWQSIYTRIDRTLPNEPQIAEELEQQIQILEETYREAKSLYEEAQKANQQASAHNARVSVWQENHNKYLQDLNRLEKEIYEFRQRTSNLDTLKKAFSTNGLVAYKLENLVKDLELMTNEYLLELSDGRFVLEFNLEKDKLNIVIIDNGHFISISALSAGELARVNAATLLAIRKLMNSISKTQINILFLDEIINVLDEDGREKLVEVLLEEDLNTFLVSHGWTHPMLNKIEVVKEDDISRLEYS